MKNKSAVQRGLEKINSNDFFELYRDNKRTFLFPYQNNNYVSFYGWLYDQYIKSLVKEINNFNSFLEKSFPYKREILNENIRLILVKLNITISNTIALIEPLLRTNKELKLNECTFILIDQQDKNILKKETKNKQNIFYDKRHIDNFCSNVFHTLKYFLSFFVDYKAKPKEFEDYIISYFNNEYENDLKEHDNNLQKYQEDLKEWRKLKLKDKKSKAKKPIRPVKPTRETSILKAIRKAKEENCFTAYHELFNRYIDYSDTKLNNDYRSKVIQQLGKYRNKLKEESENPPDKLIEIYIN